MYVSKKRDVKTTYDLQIHVHLPVTCNFYVVEVADFTGNIPENNRHVHNNPSRKGLEQNIYFRQCVPNLKIEAFCNHINTRETRAHCIPVPTTEKSQ